MTSAPATRGTGPPAGDPRVPEPRPWIRSIAGYIPGRRGRDPARSLSTNESPIPPAAGVAEAVIDRLSTLQHYPDPLADDLRRDLAGRLNVDPEQILVGNGSDQLMFLLGLAYASGGGTVVCADPPYGLHRLVPQIFNANVVTVPLRSYRHDLAAMAEVPADLAFICNPHNPTGTTVSATEIERFVTTSRARLTVVDEAYIEFCEDPAATTAVPLAGQGGAVVLRTFSKAMGLAGARIGYAVAPLEVVRTLRSIRPVYSVNSLAQAAASAALRDTDHLDRVRAYVGSTRLRLTRLLESRGYEPIRSEANFVLAIVPNETELCAGLLERGISVRPGSELGMPGSIRVSVPSPEGFAVLEQALSEL